MREMTSGAERNYRGRWIGFVVMCLISLLTFTVIFHNPLRFRDNFLTRFRHRERTRACQYNMLQLGLGVKMYLADNDNCFPPNRSGSEWSRVLYPLTHSKDIYVCTEPRPLASEGSRSLGLYFWFNKNLAGLHANAIRHAQSTFMTGDGNDGSDVTSFAYSISRMPPEWLTDINKPPYIHAGGANYLFVDGHVKWIRPKDLGKYTFEVR